MDQVRGVLRYNQYAYRTEQTYCQWILCYIYFFGGKTHPNMLAGIRESGGIRGHVGGIRGQGNQEGNQGTQGIRGQGNQEGNQGTQGIRGHVTVFWDGRADRDAYLYRLFPQR